MPIPVEPFPRLHPFHPRSLEQLSNSAPISVNSVWTQLDVLTEYQFAHRLFGVGTERLLLLWGITERKPYAQKLLFGYQDLHGIAVGNAYDPAMNHRLLTEYGVRQQQNQKADSQY
jgi:hypothetical protein